MKSYGNETREWNDNKGFLERLDERFNEANKAANDGFIITWYRHLRTIYRIMHHKIKDDAETRKLKDEPFNVFDYLETRFQSAKNSIGSLNENVGNKFISAQLQTFSITTAEEILDDIDTVLSDLYVKYFIRLALDDTDPGEAIKEVFKQ